jgi:hypothetical protein
MKKIQVSLCLALVCVVASSLVALAQGTMVTLGTSLSGFDEVGAPVLAPNTSNAHGAFQATLSSDGKTLSYTLTWTQFSSSVLFAHIHFAMRGVNGGIMAFLCGGGGKPGCAGGTATGTITMADIVAVPAQGIAVNDFTDFLRAIQARDAYVNIHTTNFPGGEIRGQIKVLP